jgi:hypothetical protein
MCRSQLLDVCGRTALETLSPVPEGAFAETGASRKLFGLTVYALAVCGERLNNHVGALFRENHLCELLPVFGGGVDNLVEPVKGTQIDLIDRSIFAIELFEQKFNGSLCCLAVRKPVLSLL